MSILSTTNSGKSSIIISEEFLIKQNWRKYASLDNIFVPTRFDAPVTFIQVSKFLDINHKVHNIFFTLLEDFESRIRYIVFLFYTNDYDLFVDYKFNHKRKSLDELINKTGIVLPHLSDHDIRLLREGDFPSVLKKDIESILNKRK